MNQWFFLSFLDDFEILKVKIHSCAGRVQEKVNPIKEEEKETHKNRKEELKSQQMFLSGLREEHGVIKQQATTPVL